MIHSQFDSVYRARRSLRMAFTILRHGGEPRRIIERARAANGAVGACDGFHVIHVGCSGSVAGEACHSPRLKNSPAPGLYGAGRGEGCRFWSEPLEEVCPQSDDPLFTSRCATGRRANGLRPSGPICGERLCQRAEHEGDVAADVVLKRVSPSMRAKIGIDTKNANTDCRKILQHFAQRHEKVSENFTNRLAPDQ